MPSAVMRKQKTSVYSSIVLEVGLPPPCPALVSTIIIRGLVCKLDQSQTLKQDEMYDMHIGTISTTEGLQVSTNASRPIRFQQSSQQPNLIGLEVFVLACSPSVVLSVPAKRDLRQKDK